MSVGHIALPFPRAIPYARVATIAQGGMGYVELVCRREQRFVRWYARKRLHQNFRDDVAFRSMFMDEARLAGLVRHPNVVGVLDVGEDAEGPYLIMEYVAGVSLSRLIAEAASGGRLVPMQIAMRICMEAARGLHAAHEARAEDGTNLHLVHRDVSPQNILIGYDGSVKVTDFGIAKALGNATRTNAGVLKGNVGYVSPEQLRFEEIDRRSDFFSLGVTLYELLSGVRLYRNETEFEGTRRILSEPPPDIGEIRSDVPPELCELLFELLAKERESRPATGIEIAGRLEATLAGLIGEEGSVTVGNYMEQHFAAAAEEHGAALSAHLRELETAAQRAPESSTTPPTSFAPAGIARVPSAGAPVPAPHFGHTARQSSARWRMVAVAVGSVAAAAVVALAVWPKPPAPALPAASATTPLSAPVASPTITAPSAGTSTSTMPATRDREGLAMGDAGEGAAGRRVASERDQAKAETRASRRKSRSARPASARIEAGKGKMSSGNSRNLTVPLFTRWQ